MTSFEKKVYTIVRSIPRGRVATYGIIARAAGNPNAARAIGNALNKNYSSAIPCHRVVRSDGSTGGYNRGIARKIALLQRERVRSRGNVLALDVYVWIPQQKKK